MSRTLSCICKLKQKVCCLTRRPLTYCYLTSTKECRFYGTSIYVSEKHPKKYFEFDHGLEEKFKNLDDLKKLCCRRRCDLDIDLLKRNYEQVNTLHQEKDNLDKLRVENSKIIAGIIKQKETNESETLKKTCIVKGRELKERFRHLQETLWDLEQCVMEQALSLPNELLPNVVEEEEVLETYFEGQEMITNRSHLDVLKSTEEVVFSNVGNKAYYLRGKLALLEQDLKQRFSAELRRQDLTCILAPEIFTTPIVEAGCVDVTDPSSINRMTIKHIDPAVELDWQLDNTYLYGASHLSFLAYFARTIIDTSTPDSKMFVVGRHYRASADVDLPGLFGVLQSVKVCMCSVNTLETNSLVAMETFKTILIDVYKQFNIPFRVVSMPIGGLTAMEMNRIELQMWVPSLREYLKIASISYCGDYSSRRLMTRSAEDKDLTDTRPVYMVHSEVTDVTKLIAILIENGQTDVYGIEF